MQEATPTRLCPGMLRVLTEAATSGCCCSKTIAARLDMTPAAVDQHFCRAMQCLQADSRSGALLKAMIGGHMPGYRLTCPDPSPGGDGPMQGERQAAVRESDIRH